MRMKILSMHTTTNFLRNQLPMRLMTHHPDENGELGERMTWKCALKRATSGSSFWGLHFEEAGANSEVEAEKVRKNNQNMTQPTHMLFGTKLVLFVIDSPLKPRMMLLENTLN